MNTSSRFNFQTISVSKVHKFLHSLNPCKSTGIDNIPAKIIRIASPVIVKSITEIFKRAILSKVVPSEWKSARVIPLHKKGLHRIHVSLI